ncbi:MAG: ferritin-like domain-containing protein [Firmicutes bacterium]|nr:ferritin-like domain-containing protein [Bacillota bacterium]
MERTLADRLRQGMLIQSRAVRALGIMAQAAVNRHDKELLSAIRREDRRHYYFLEGIYEDLTGRACPSPSVSLSLPKNYPDMLRTAICDKLAAIDFYEEWIDDVKCLRQKDLLEIVVSDQKEHARILAAIYRRL